MFVYRIILGFILSVIVFANAQEDVDYIKATDYVNDFRKTVPCRSMFNNIQSNPNVKKECIPSECLRRVIDGVFSDADVERLHEIAKKGMSQRTELGGPTILDINTGYIRDIDGLDNLFFKPTDIYSAEDFAHYGRIISELKKQVMQSFNISSLYFTAPTFITRINSDLPWEIKGIHDEYWHAHSDHNNTDHYHYSGLLYMSTYNEDFTGGRIKFIEADSFSYEEENNPEFNKPELIMEPRKGRIMIFSSGHENTHLVEPVLTGKRFILSFWFTCDSSKEFQIFLDGQAHIQFSHKMKESIERRQRAAKAKTSEL